MDSEFNIQSEAQWEYVAKNKHIEFGICPVWLRDLYNPEAKLNRIVDPVCEGFPGRHVVRGMDSKKIDRRDYLGKANLSGRIVLMA